MQNERKNKGFNFHFATDLHKNRKTSVDEVSPDYHTTLVESLINVNLTELYWVNEDQASIHRQYNIMHVFALPLGLPL